MFTAKVSNLYFKQFFCLLVFILSASVSNSQPTNSQIINKFSIDINLARLAKDKGILNVHPNKLSYLNGFLIRYSATEKLEPYLGIRKIETFILSPPCFVCESSNIKGAEIRLGTRFTPNKNKKLFLNYGLELFGEFTKLEGYFVSDSEAAREINHRKIAYGLAPILGINFRIAKKIVLFVDTRFLMGRESLNQLETHSTRMLYRNTKELLFVYEPINSLGISLRL